MRERGRGWSESNPGRGEGGLVRRGGKGSLFSVRALGIPHVVDLQLQLLDADVPLVEHLPQTPDLLLLLVELQTQLHTQHTHTHMHRTHIEKECG